MREEIADELEAFVGQVRDRRQPQVDERDVGARPLAQPRDRGRAIAGERDFVVRGEREGEAFGDERVVVDQEQAGLLHRSIIILACPKIFSSTSRR